VDPAAAHRHRCRRSHRVHPGSAEGLRVLDAELLRSATPPTDLARSVRVEVPANTAVLVITFEADSPQSAQSGSHAFAEAYLRNREETARASLNGQISALNLKVKQLTAILTDINDRLAKTAAGSAQRSNLESLRNNSQNQLNTLTGRLNVLTTRRRPARTRP
jgi:succinoglycan biosynthesis transport protein ExoP